MACLSSIRRCPKSRVGIDVISLINVFSHIPDFEDFLRQVVEHSSPGGVVFLEIGNGGVPSMPA